MRPTSSDFVPWRFSDACCRCPWLQSSGRRRRNLHKLRHLGALAAVSFDTDYFADLKRHKVFSNLERAAVGMPHLGDEFLDRSGRYVWAGEEDKICKRGELGFVCAKMCPAARAVVWCAMMRWIKGSEANSGLRWQPREQGDRRMRRAR